jgi:hypothetical protein
MRRGWIAATAAVLLTAGWAVAQVPLPAAPAPAGVAVEAPANGAGDSWYAGLLGGPAYDSPPPYRFYGGADFLVWRINSTNLPALATSVPLGVIQAPTQVFVNGVPQFNPPPELLFPFRVESSSTFANGPSLSFSEQLGGRFTAGIWLDPDASLGLEATAFFLNRISLGFNSTTGNTLNESLITLPTTTTIIVTGTNVGGGAGFSRTLNAAVVRDATATLVGTSSTEIWGAELNARCTSASLGAVSGFVGLRYLNFREVLDMHNSSHLFGPPAQFPDSTAVGVPTDLTFDSADRIRTTNNFYGAQVGLDLDMFAGRFIIDLRAKVALGVMHETADVFGASVSTSIPPTILPNQGIPVPGGLLSSPLDQGQHSRNRISAVPEINVKLGYMITPSLRAYVGYDFLYVANVLRPGDQTGISTSGVTAIVDGTSSALTITHPAFRFKDSDIWYNGINFGLEYRF